MTGTLVSRTLCIRRTLCDDWYSTPMVIFAVLTVFWLFLTIGVPIVTGLPRLYQQCNNSVPIVKNSQTAKNNHRCTNHHMSTQSPPNTQSPRLHPPNTQSRFPEVYSPLERIYIYIFIRSEWAAYKKTIKKQQQTTKQTGINTALTKISYHMTC